MPDGPALTRWFCVVVFVLVVAFDVWVIHRHGRDASISVVLHDWACDAPIVAALAGGIVCHIFWKH